MATKLSFDQLKGQIDRLRKDSIEVVANANKIVYGGVQKLADKELKALNEYYKSALASIKAARHDDIKGAAQKQIDLLQDTVTQVIGHARESIGIVAEARAELAKLVQNSSKGTQIAEKTLEKAVEPARKALAKAKVKAEAARKAVTEVVKTAQKDAKKEMVKVERAAKADVKTVGKAMKSAEKKVGVAAKKAEKKVNAVARTAIADAKAGVAAAKKAINRITPSPSPNSRASRATSKAKQAVTDVVETATTAVNNAVTTVVDAVKSAG